MNRYVLECLIGLLFACTIILASFASTSVIPFIYQGF